MNTYILNVEVEDDPVYRAYNIVVAAPNERTARAMARKAALDAYNAIAGGYSRNPVATVTDSEPYTLPVSQGVISVSEVS